MVARLCDGSSTNEARTKKKQERNSFSSVVLPREALPVLTPLKSLGGLSLVAYMAIEAQEGHVQMLKSWKVDLAKDLSNSLNRVKELGEQLSVANDRIEDLEIMVNDLTSFVELQKDQIARLNARVVEEIA